MKSYTIPYGKGTLTFSIPDQYRVDVISPRHVPAAEQPVTLVEQAIRQPIGGGYLEKFNTASSVAIAINDKTRPVPNHFLLPPLLRALEEIGIKRQSIRFIIASGTHVPMRADEFKSILPEEILRDYPVTAHDADDAVNLVQLGETSSHTPVSINRFFYEADLKIVIGDIEPHHFAGFSGGMKTAAIGLAGRDTIDRNHRMIIDPRTVIAEFEGNPLRQDIEEIGRKVGVHLALNALLNIDREIVHVLFGDPLEVMKKGIPLSRKISQVEAAADYDLVIASPGGFPKDINLVQAQKATTHAALITRPGGKIILAAECIEGSGSKGYELWMEGIGSTQQVLKKTIQGEFKVGPHKAFQFARIQQDHEISIVSAVPQPLLHKLLLTGKSSIDEALQDALSQLSPGSRIAILPKATNTIPLISQG